MKQSNCCVVHHVQTYTIFQSLSIVVRIVESGDRNLEVTTSSVSNVFSFCASWFGFQGENVRLAMALNTIRYEMCGSSVLICCTIPFIPQHSYLSHFMNTDHLTHRERLEIYPNTISVGIWDAVEEHKC